MILRYQVSRIVNIYSRGETLNVNRPLPYFNTDIPTLVQTTRPIYHDRSHLIEKWKKRFFPLSLLILLKVVRFIVNFSWMDTCYVTLINDTRNFSIHACNFTKSIDPRILIIPITNHRGRSVCFEINSTCIDNQW